MQRQNELIAEDKMVSLRFPFKPSKIPVNSELEYTPDSKEFMYSAIVFRNDDQKWGILEFGEDVMIVLNAYALRNGGMQKLECLFTRYKDGTLKVNAGFDNLEAIFKLVGDSDFEKKTDLAGRLIERYEKLSRMQKIQLMK